MNSNTEWKVQVLGDRLRGWEITVIRYDYRHGQKSWGWFCKDKILVSDSSPCGQPLLEFVWDENIRIAHALCEKLNQGEFSEDLLKLKEKCTP